MADAETATTLSINPATGAVIERFPLLDAAGREAAVAGAQAGFLAWRGTPVAERVAVFRRLADLLRRDADRLALSITREMGKPIGQARGEVAKCALTLDWYAEHGPALLADEATEIEDDKAVISFLPIGVVLAVMPWNFPVWQVIRAGVPILLAGNGLILKHAPNVLRSAENLLALFEEAGFAKGAFSLLNCHHEHVADVIADDRIAAVTLTGSVRAGAAVAAEAGRNVKKSLLELGGSDPYIVLADADLDLAVATAVTARFQNSGQACIAAKRIILEASVADAFTERFVAMVKALRVGDPEDEATVVGPMARADLRDELHGQVERTVAAGAVLLAGGHPMGPDGSAFYAPTVLGGVRPGMAAFVEETFGPVAALIVAKDEDEALTMANDSRYGLSASIWTADLDRARAMARRLEAGGVFINGYAASDARAPMGGVKQSGYGRELSHFGVREFTNAQLVWRDRR